MKLSEAVRLGSLYLTPLAGIRNDGNGQGCAIGMAEFAFGCRKNDLETKLPWLGEECNFPCDCDHVFYGINYAIAHVFNQHVCGDKTWTLDQLADWIASIDPQEPEACTENEQTEAVEVFV